MSKIESITPEQEAQFPHYVKKWIGIGSATHRVTAELAKPIVDDFRELIKMTRDVPLVLADNPIEAWVLCCLHEAGVPLEELHAEMVTVFNGNPKKYEIPQASAPFQNTPFLASSFAFYETMFEVVGVKLPEDLEAKYKVWAATTALWGIYPLDNLTVVSQHPTTVKLNENNVLHCDGGPALEFAGLGDFKIFCLNGVAVPEYLAVTPGHQLDLKQYHSEKNADVKAEFIRKAGIERFLELGKKLDSYDKYDQEENTWWWKSEYELWDMSSLFPNLEAAPYLKMLNQTTGGWHMEGVSPKCTTLKQAIKERFGGRDMRIVNVA